MAVISLRIGVNCPKIKIGVICHFFRAPMRFQVQRFISFISQKNFDFISQNRAFLRRAQTHEKTHEKKNSDHIFFLCAYAFSSAKIHRFQKLFFYLSKSCVCAPRQFLFWGNLH